MTDVNDTTPPAALMNEAAATLERIACDTRRAHTTSADREAWDRPEARAAHQHAVALARQLRRSAVTTAWSEAFPVPDAETRMVPMAPTPAMLRAIMGCDTEEDALLGWQTALQVAPAAHAAPVEMGHGTVAVGTCTRSTDGVPGIVYLRIPGAPRDHGADCADLYQVGAPAPQGSVLACVYFLTAETLQQSIDTLREVQALHYPVPVPDAHPSGQSQQEAEPRRIYVIPDEEIVSEDIDEVVEQAVENGLAVPGESVEVEEWTLTRSIQVAARQGEGSAA